MEIFTKRKKVQIIPLGQNCIPRTILTRWKVKPSKLQGELTYPFDLAVFGIPEITKTLKTDFNEFFLNLTIKKTRNSSYLIKFPNCIEFIHDKNLKTQKEFIKKYTQRIENFKAAIASPMPILFVQILSEDEEIIQQYNELKRQRQNRPFKMNIIDTQDIVKKDNLTLYADNIFKLNSDIKILKLSYPSEEYKNNWWKKKYYTSCQGKNFEKQIVNFCCETIKELTF